MNQEQHLSLVLSQLRVRNDANETAFFARELEHVKSRTFDVRYPEFKARSLIPVNNEAGEHVDTITYRQFDQVGKAKVISNYSADPPIVNVNGKEFSNKVYTWGDAYEYSIDDLERSIALGRALPDMQAKAARRAMEEAFDSYAAFGDSQLGTKGVLNHASIPLVVLPNVGSWSGLSATQILENMNALVGSVYVATKEIFPPDTLVLDPDSFQTINQTATGVDNQITIAKSFLQNNPWIKNLETWHRCTGAGAGSIKRIICYKRDAEVIENNEPMPFQTLPPQAINYSFRVPCRARFGGIELHYPKAFAHADVA